MFVALCIGLLFLSSSCYSLLIHMKHNSPELDRAEICTVSVCCAICRPFINDTLHIERISTNPNPVDSAPLWAQTMFHRCVFLAVITHRTFVLSTDLEINGEEGKWFFWELFGEQLGHPCHIVMWRIAEGHLDSLGQSVCLWIIHPRERDRDISTPCESQRALCLSQCFSSQVGTI